MAKLPSTNHKYVQLKEQLLDGIQKGVYPEGGALPSIQKIMAEKGVAQGTAVRAIAALEGEGVVERRPGVGVFVRRRTRPCGMVLRLNSIAEFLWERAGPTIRKTEDCRVIVGAPGVSPEETDILNVVPNLTTDLASQGRIVPLDSFLERDKSFAASLDERCPLYIRNGETFAIPVYFAPLSAYINLDLFAKAGVPAPKGDWTLDDLERIASTFSEAGVRPALTWSASHIHYILPLLCGDGDLFEGDSGRPRLAHPATLEHFERLRRMGFVAGAPCGEGVYEAWRAFAEGQTPVTFWGTSPCRGSNAFRFEVAPLPGATSTVILSDGLAISSACRQPERAWELIARFVRDLAPPALIESQMMFPATTRGALDFIAHHGDGYADAYARLGHPILSHLPLGAKRLMVLAHALGRWWEKDVDLKERLASAQMVIDTLMAADAVPDEHFASA